MDLFIDFSLVEQKGIGDKKEDPLKNYLSKYDDTTCVYYKSHRIKKTDPITFDELNDEIAFKFPYVWDPYTGLRLGEDPSGPLYFHPMNLLNHIYQSRLKTLWVEASDENNGFYEGYFGEGVGQGEDFEIVGRGIYPERYVFRIPIQNCYLKKNHKMTLVTMGPKLTDCEIHELDRLIIKHWSRHRLYNRIYKKIGSLYKLKCYYEIAISRSPLTMDMSGMDMSGMDMSGMDMSGMQLKSKDTVIKERELNMYLNRMAVESIKKMI